MNDSPAALRLSVYGMLLPGGKLHWMIHRYLRNAVQ